MIGFGIDHGDVTIQFEAQAQLGQLLRQDAPPPDECWLHDAVIQGILNCAQDAFVLALAIDHAPATPAHRLEHRQQQLRRAQVLLSQCAAILLKIDGAPGHPAVHRGPGDRRGDL